MKNNKTKDQLNTSESGFIEKKDFNQIFKEIAMMKLRLAETLILKNKLVHEQLYNEAADIRAQEVVIRAYFSTLKEQLEWEDNQLAMTRTNFDRKYDLCRLIHELTPLEDTDFLDETKERTKAAIASLMEQRKNPAKKVSDGVEEVLQDQILSELMDQRELLEVLNRIIERRDRVKRGI